MGLATTARCGLCVPLTTCHNATDFLNGHQQKVVKAARAGNSAVFVHIPFVPSRISEFCNLLNFERVLKGCETNGFGAPTLSGASELAVFLPKTFTMAALLQTTTFLSRACSLSDRRPTPSHAALSLGKLVRSRTPQPNTCIS